ncbi:MAG: Xaa-Pro dipeptidyl-peptidase, partial [Planctomycetota bacterium]
HAMPIWSVPVSAEDPKATAASKAAITIVDGEAQVVEAFKDQKEWIREFLWVETSFDSDGDGKLDRMHVDVTRPKQTATEGLKVPVIYETSPYFSGTGPNGLEFFWDAKQEVGAPPPVRKPMPDVKRPDKPGMIAQSEVRTWVPRGFAVVHSCSPGTGYSDGCPTVGADNESLAPKAVIDWLCGRAKGYTTQRGTEEIKADWCTGKVGMIGTSYNGTLPLAAATTGVEGLEAIVPIAPNTSYYHYYRSHGLVRHPGGYLGEDIDVLYDFIHSGDPEKREYCNETVREKELKQLFDRQHGDWNEFWAGRDYLLDLKPMKAATLMSHGFNDWNVMPEHSNRIYQALKQQGVPSIIYYHQGGHGGPPPLSLVNRWFTRFLLGVENGVEKGPRSYIVREQDKSKDPTAYPDYPHPDARMVVLNPTPGGNGSGGNGSGGNKLGGLNLKGVSKSTKERLVDDVAQSGEQLAMAEESPHRLLYATEPLSAPLHISGTARLSIRVASSKPAANLSVWLVSLPWTEKAKITDNVITRGWADPQNHASLEKGVPLKPGAFVDLSFDLQPDDQIIAAGERIGLMIFSSDRDFTLWPAAGTELTIDLDATLLELPVVGGSEAFQKATAK